MVQELKLLGPHSIALISRQHTVSIPRYNNEKGGEREKAILQKELLYDTKLYMYQPLLLYMYFIPH